MAIKVSGTCWLFVTSQLLGYIERTLELLYSRREARRGLESCNTNARRGAKASQSARPSAARIANCG